MDTQDFYRMGLWDAIIRHPGFTLGTRERKALERFLPVASELVVHATNMLHIGIGNGREVPLIVPSFSIDTYLLNDICCPLLMKVTEDVRNRFPRIHFKKACTDVEKPGMLGRLRRRLDGPTMVILIANGVIFADRNLDAELRDAMREEDLFLVTAETPHQGMFDSYDIDPVYALISESGLLVGKHNCRISYDPASQLLEMSREDTPLLASYKPTREQLVRRMRNAGMREVKLLEFPDIHQLAGVFRRW